MKRKLGIAISTFALMLVGIWLLITNVNFGAWDVPGASKRLEATLAKSKELGLPLTAAEVWPGPEVKPEENCGPTLMAIAREVGKAKVNLRALLHPKDVRTTQAPREEWLATYQAELDEAVIEIERPYFKIDPDYDQSVSLAYDAGQGLRKLQTMLLARSLMRAEAGRHAEALKDFRAACLIPQRLAQEPSVLGMVYGASLEATALSVSIELAQLWQGDRDRLTDLRKEIEATKPSLEPLRAIRAEFYLGVALARNLHRYGGPSTILKAGGKEPESYNHDPFANPKGEVKRDGLPTGMIERAFLQAYADATNEAIEEAKTTKDGDRLVLDISNRIYEGRVKDAAISERMIRALGVQRGPGIQFIERAEARRATTLALLEAIRYKAESGRWPASLKEIGAERKDPFDPGKPVKYLVAGKEVRVYSLGQNGKDEKGRYREYPNFDADDIAAIFPPLKQKD